IQKEYFGDNLAMDVNEIQGILETVPVKPIVIEEAEVEVVTPKPTAVAEVATYSDFPQVFPKTGPVISAAQT
ncbi:MAG: hypothetical protein GTN36_04590, partial [Candidatus Aenigmarchaeota archaeon]|nr:hypothetical protein [Candidatus Aenigmarchaeota archaeon]